MRARRRRRSISRTLRRLSASARNAVEVMRLGRLGAPYAAPFEVLQEDRVHKLRRYLSPAMQNESACSLGPVLLVPPLMVTSEVYDISPDLSAVVQLVSAGLDVWLVDFGAPERTEGGLKRTLDDHVRAVDQSIDEVRRCTGRDVHLLGYSQGGMFCYQVAALRRSAGLRSIVTFGSPVDIRRNLPGLGVDTAERLIAAASRAIEGPLARIEALPGFLTSTGFKVLSLRKELLQLVDFVQKLHDRQALEKRESRRRFLAGEGFVAWPGPALRKFVDEFVVHNRLASGGFVIDGRTVTLADIRCPILYFVGETDELARAPAVRAIREAAPAADIYEIALRAGHFGLVVGSKALGATWPSVVEWVRWIEGQGPRPRLLVPEGARSEPVGPEVDERDDAPLDVAAFYDVTRSALGVLRTRLGEVGREVGQSIDTLRWQVPRLQRLRRIGPDTRVSMGRALAEQAAAIPEGTFFLWKGRAFTYREADRRVDNVVRGLLHVGVRPGMHVAVLMATRPSYLSIVCALNRLGAVAVLLSPDSTRITIEHALELAPWDFLVTDPEHAARAKEAYSGPVLSLGGFGDRPALPPGVLDMESIDPEAVALPQGFEPNAGRASDLAMIIFTAGRDETPRAARITNRRWAFSAFGAAAGCMLTSKDTVYCCLPLHHAAGMLVAVGGALVGGSRLALAPRFDPEAFWPDVRRYGATVAFYAGDMLRALVEAPASPMDAHAPLRLFAGSGMRTDVWQRITQRFGRASVLEFYASTEGNAVLANASGAKIGALGRPLPGTADMALLAWDFTRDDFVRDPKGRPITSAVDEPGVLVARIHVAHPTASFDGYAGTDDSRGRVLRNVFETDDAWFVTGDLMRRDADGDYWFIDRLSDVVRGASGPIATIAIEDALARLPSVLRAAVYGVSIVGEVGEVLVAAVVPRHADTAPEQVGREIARALPPEIRPRFVRLVREIPLTDGYRMRKVSLRQAGIGLATGTPTLAYDAAREVYTLVSPGADTAQAKD